MRVIWVRVRDSKYSSFLDINYSRFVGSWIARRRKWFQRFKCHSQVTWPCVKLKENNMGTFKSEVDLASSTLGPKYFCTCIGIFKHLKLNCFNHLTTKTHCVLLEHYYSVDFPWWFDRKISFLSKTADNMMIRKKKLLNDRNSKLHFVIWRKKAASIESKSKTIFSVKSSWEVHWIIMFQKDLVWNLQTLGLKK